MEETPKTATTKRLRVSGLEWIVLLIFIGTIILALKPLLELRYISEEVQRLKTEAQRLKTEIVTLTQEADAAEVKWTSASRQLAEANILVERAKAMRDTEEGLRKQALADRLIQENLQRSLSQTNNILAIEIGKMRQEMADHEAQASEMQAQTNKLFVVIQQAEIRANRLRQEEVGAQARIRGQNDAITNLLADNKRLVAEITKLDAELRQKQAQINTIIAANEQEERRKANLAQSIQQTDAAQNVTQDALKKKQGELKLEEEKLTNAKQQADAARAEVVAQAGKLERDKKELADLQRQIDTTKAAGVQEQAEIKRLQALVSVEEVKLKKLHSDMLKAREAEAAARIGEVSAQQRTEDAQREEAIIRKNIELVKQTLADLQKTLKTATATEKQP